MSWFSLLSMLCHSICHTYSPSLHPSQLQVIGLLASAQCKLCLEYFALWKCVMPTCYKCYPMKDTLSLSLNWMPFFSSLCSYKLFWLILCVKYHFLPCLIVNCLHANASPLDHKPLDIFQVLFPIIDPQHGKMQCPTWDLAGLKRTDLYDCHSPDLALRRLQKTHSAHRTVSRMVLTEVCTSVQGLLFWSLKWQLSGEGSRLIPGNTQWSLPA